MRDVVEDAGAISVRPDLWIPAVSLSLVADVVVAAVDWPFRSGLPPPPERAITIMVLTILGRAWFGLTVSRIALALLRGQVGGMLNQWVPVQMALQVGVVTLALALPITLGAFCLVVPGAYLAARWSQVVMLVLDGRAEWFAAVEHSSALTAGFRFHIVLILVSAAVAAAMGDYLFNNITPLAWAWRAVTSTFGAALTASLYYHLSLRAPWNPEAAA